MNIGLFTDTYFPQINGVATSTKLLATELRKKGHRVYIFTTSDPDQKSPEFDVFRLPSVAFIFLKSHRTSIMYSPKALSMIKKMNLDIIHTQTEFSLGIFGKITSIRLKLPHVHTMHTMYPDYVHYIANGHLITPKMAAKFCRICCNVSKTVIAPTEKVKDFLISAGVKKEIKIIPTGMDLSAFDRRLIPQSAIDAAKQSNGLTEDNKILVSIGRIGKEKSIDVLIKAMPEIARLLPAARLVIVGDGPFKAELSKLSRTLNVSDRVIFTGAVAWSDIAPYYAMADVFVSASVSEAQGLTFIEAMAAETMIVAKRDDCLSGIVTDGVTGLLYDNDEALPQAIANALADDELRKRLSAAAYESVCNMSSERFAESVLEVYNELLDNNNAASAKEKRALPVKGLFERFKKGRRNKSSKL